MYRWNFREIWASRLFLDCLLLWFINLTLWLKVGLYIFTKNLIYLISFLVLHVLNEARKERLWFIWWFLLLHCIYLLEKRTDLVLNSYKILLSSLTYITNSTLLWYFWYPSIWKIRTFNLIFKKIHLVIVHSFFHKSRLWYLFISLKWRNISWLPTANLSLLIFVQ